MPTTDDITRAIFSSPQSGVILRNMEAVINAINSAEGRRLDEFVDERQGEINDNDRERSRYSEHNVTAQKHRDKSAHDAANKCSERRFGRSCGI